jgi:hypothetical protein
MDPFIEACGLWEDFHPKLISEIERALSAVVPEKYSVRLRVRSYVTLADTEGNDFNPVLAEGFVTAAPSIGGLDSSPVTMQAFIAKELRETFIEIHEHDPEKQLVTCIEVLSPSNKQRGSKGRKLYRRKRNALLLGTAHLVELDLLRGGQRMPMMSVWPDSPYTLLVSRELHAPRCKVWPAHFRKPLPSLVIPLSYPDPDVRLDLQALVAVVYARSHYDRRLDYLRPLQPALTEEDSAWLAEQLRSRS